MGGSLAWMGSNRMVNWFDEPPEPRKALRGGIQTSILTDFSGNVCDSRQMLTKTSQWLQERASDTPTKGLLWLL